MKWLSTTPILFSVGIICAIAETAVANPWDSFVSDQQIFEAQTIRCDFIKGVSADWDGAGQGFGHCQEPQNVLKSIFNQ